MIYLVMRSHLSPFERKTGMSEVLNESPAKTSESRTDGTADSNAGNANTVYEMMKQRT